MTYMQFTMIGNCGRDPELRYTATGTAVTDFSIAHTEKWTDASGAKQERTTWAKVTCWKRQAEIVAQYVKKGQQVMVVGTVEASAYLGNDGTARASLDVTAKDVIFLNNRNDTAPGDGLPVYTPPADSEDIPF